MSSMCVGIPACLSAGADVAVVQVRREAADKSVFDIGVFVCGPSAMVGDVLRTTQASSYPLWESVQLTRVLCRKRVMRERDCLLRARC